jgi:hypothetical protein
MSLGQLLLLHLMAGASVAVAVFLSTKTAAPALRSFQVLTAVMFWPLYVPILLAARKGVPATSPVRPSAQPPDDLARVIMQVDAELEAALQSLDGWAEGVLAREEDRLHELRTAWTAQAARIREMDKLLSRPEYAGVVDDPLPGTTTGDFPERLRGSQEIIRQNMERLKQVRRRTFEDLVGTLAWVRELVSMIHLAKFTGAPASRAEELVAQIAAAVEGLSAVSNQIAGPSNTGEMTPAQL